jgi:hypothetical protein
MRAENRETEEIYVRQHRAARSWTSRGARRIPMAIKVGTSSNASSTATLEVGDTAPDFELPSHRGNEKVRLSSFQGTKNVVLVFYPLDWTAV